MKSNFHRLISIKQCLTAWTPTVTQKPYHCINLSWTNNKNKNFFSRAYSLQMPIFTALSLLVRGYKNVLFVKASNTLIDAGDCFMACLLLDNIRSILDIWKEGKYGTNIHFFISQYIRKKILHLQMTSQKPNTPVINCHVTYLISTNLSWLSNLTSEMSKNQIYLLTINICLN